MSLEGRKITKQETERNLYREEKLNLTKLQQTLNIFDKPDSLSLTPSGTREEDNDAMAFVTQQEIVENINTTHVEMWKLDHSTVITFLYAIFWLLLLLLT